jgi:dipeptidyl aminopeptidase/acylaminoacyl peptidase
MRQLLTLTVLVIVCFGTAQADTSPLPVKELLSARSFAFLVPISISNDGEWVAYTVNDNTKVAAPTDERYSLYTPTGAFVRGVSGTIYISNLRTGKSINLTNSQGSSWSPQWSPDSRYLAFFSDRGGVAQLWVWEKASARIRRVSDAIVRPLADKFQWSPDSRTVITRVLPEGLTIEAAADLMTVRPAQAPEKNAAGGSTVTIYRSPPAEKPVKSNISITKEGPWSLNRWLGDLALIDIQSGKTRRITGIIPAEYWVSPDGSQIVFSNLQGFVPNSQEMLSDLVVVSFGSNDLRVLVPNVALPFGSAVSWSPDGKLIAYKTSEPRSKSNCYVISVIGGEPRNLTGNTKANLGGRRYPLWDANGRNVLLVGDNSLWKASVETGTTTLVGKIPGREILSVVAGPKQGQFWAADGGSSVVVNTRDIETKKAGLYSINLTNGAATKLIEENKAYGSFRYEVVVSSDQKSIVYLAQDSQRPPDLWLYTLGANNSRRITAIYPQLEHYTMGESRLVEWTTSDGARLRGALLLPSNYDPGKRYPLIVKVYATGFGSNAVNEFGFAEAAVDNLQLLATRGYAVLYPDIPVNQQSPLKDLSKAVLPAIDKLIELGIADPDRLGVMGHSFGGYSTLALIVQTPRFKAAVESAGFANMVGIFGEMNKDGSAYGVALGQLPAGPPWVLRDIYVENSPIFYFDKIETPLLIIHGSADTAVSHFLADEVFVGLRSLRKEVTYALYQGESHFPASWSYANQVDYAQRAIDWFDKYLQPAKVTIQSSRE